MPRYSKSQRKAYALKKEREAIKKLREIAHEIGFNLTPMKRKEHPHMGTHFDTGLRILYKDSENDANVLYRWIQKRDQINTYISSKFKGDNVQPYVENIGLPKNEGAHWVIILPDYTKDGKMGNALSFRTYLDTTPKEKVVAFLNDYKTKRVNMAMTKGMLYRVCEEYGYIQDIENLINEVRGHVDFEKYGL